MVYKISYFPIPGRAQMIRNLLDFVGAEYEDNRVPKEKWLELKPKQPFNQLPVLEDGDFRLTQSCAIFTYLAKKEGVWYKDQKDDALALSLIFVVYDLSNELARIIFGPGSAEEKVAKQKEFLQGKFVNTIKNLDKIVRNTEGGFLGGEVAAIDISLHDFFLTLELSVPNFGEILGNAEKVATWYNNLKKNEKVAAIEKKIVPSIQQFLKSMS